MKNLSHVSINERTHFTYIHVYSIVTYHLMWQPSRYLYSTMHSLYKNNQFYLLCQFSTYILLYMNVLFIWARNKTPILYYASLCAGIQISWFFFLSKYCTFHVIIVPQSVWWGILLLLHATHKLQRYCMSTSYTYLQKGGWRNCKIYRRHCRQQRRRAHFQLGCSRLVLWGGGRVSCHKLSRIRKDRLTTS